MALTSKGAVYLPAGIYDIRGTFGKGDVVEVFGEIMVNREKVKSIILTRTARKVMGKRKEDVEKEMIVASSEVIHRDKWVKSNK